MWVFVSRRLRMWIIGAVAAPVVGWAVDRLGRRLEQRNGGETRVSKGLRTMSRRLRNAPATEAAARSRSSRTA